MEAVGSSVTDFNVGDEVFGDLMYHGGSAFAEFIRVREAAPTETDYTTSGPYDLILDLVCKRSMFAIRRALASGGRYSLVGGSMRALSRL